MYAHFSGVASQYRRVRTTDTEPMAYISEIVGDRPEVRAADIGCGAGRYDLLLFQYIKNLHLTCIDINNQMLKQASDYLKSEGITRFETIKANANNIPLEEKSMDCLLTFNAIHHWNFPGFIEKSGKVIKEEGKVFIYTRTRSQNQRTIWGEHFPLFSIKETRLYELDEMKDWIQSDDLLTLETVKTFQYDRKSTLEDLLEKVKARHYSTFSLYREDEIEGAMVDFQKNIRKSTLDPHSIQWTDENTLLVLKLK